MKKTLSIVATFLVVSMVLAIFTVQTGASFSVPPALEWDRTYGGTGDEEARSLVQTVDGGYAFAGYTTSFGAGGHDFWLVKTDANGGMEWNRTYGGVNHDWGYSVVQTGDGGYAMTGRTQSLGAGGWDGWLIKLAPVEIPTTLDIDPNMLNLGSKGRWITAYIELPEGYDVADINVSTIMLNGTVPSELRPTAIGDYDSDGVPDLMVKFNRTAVSELILSQGIKYGNVTLTITGKLNDGTLFEGSDVIRVRMPGDINCDGKVDIFDVVLIAARYGESNPEPYYDMNEDGKIDILDIVSVTANYGKTYQ
jgi:hypothetical protein